ncbi:MAG: cupin domain-containing protein [Solirubrobacterales bacterium]
MTRTKAGDVIENPVTGERAITLEGPGENDEQRLVSEVRIPAGGRLILEHQHPNAFEHFELLEGELDVSVDGQLRKLNAGEVVDIPAGTWHDFTNAGAEKAVVRVEVTPGARFTEMIRTLWGLALDGKTDSEGMPSRLQLVAIAKEFDDLLVLRRPPRLVQSILFGVLAPIAHMRGYRGVYPRYAEMKTEGTPEDARAGAPLTPVFGPGAGPPG